ncbi:MAG TPA: HEAT repeat domain-containing protein [Thermoanaerobaculia bacterium]|nr:HEAT repeat domain-containing protein [Thermoanaerobaculia bacterium]
MREVLEFTAALHLAAKALQFYTAEHPRGVDALTTLDRTANALLSKQSRVSIVAAKGTLLVDGEPLGSGTASNKAHVKALAHELDARQFGGIILLQGVTYRELVELVRLFVMKPPQLRDAGGAEEIFRRASVVHVRISRVRYEAITEGEEVVWSKDMASRGDDTGDDSLPMLLRKFLMQNAGEGGGGGGLGRGEGNADDIAAAILDALQRNAGDTDALTRMLASATADTHGLELLRSRLEELGISREQLDEIIGIIGWERLSPNEKIEKLLTGTAIFDVPREKLIVFLRELLEARRHEDVFRLLEVYVRGLEQEAVAARQAVIDTLGQVAAMIETPGTSPQIDQLLTRAILNRFVKENDPRLQIAVAEAVASLCVALMQTGRADVALQAMGRLEAAVSVSDPNANVRESYKSLGQAFGDPRRAAQMIAQIYGSDPEMLAKGVVPLVAQFGEALMPALMEALANEDDRNRRGRLVRALKAIGTPAHPFLLGALQSPQWFVVRNALTILGEIGEREHCGAIGRSLQHQDPRVRRTAARALGKIGGADCEAMLVAAIGDRDDETQNEVLVCLGSMKAQSAIPALADILRRRGLFAREPLPIRVAAGRALAAIGTTESLSVLRNAIAAENDRSARAALQALL